MPQAELLAITWVSVLNDPDFGLRLPPIRPVVCATARGAITRATTTPAATPSLTFPACPSLKRFSRLNIEVELLR